MADTGLAGDPQEYFNPWHMGHAEGEFPKEFAYDDAYVLKLIEKHTTPNGVFGVKTHFTQVVNFVGLGRLESLFPTPLRYIFMQRRDEIRQAVSLARAIQTDQWGWEQPASRKPEYNFYHILDCLREINVQEKGWEMYFMERNITPFRVVYEELIADPESIVVNAMNYLGIAITDGFVLPSPRLRKQADSLSEEWVAKFQTGII